MEKMGGQERKRTRRKERKKVNELDTVFFCSWKKMGIKEERRRRKKGKKWTGEKRKNNNKAKERNKMMVVVFFWNESEIKE